MIRRKNQRNVGELRNIEPKGAVDEDLARSIREMLLCAYDVGDFHEGIVDDSRKVVDGNAILAGNDKIIELLGLEVNLAANQVVDDDIFLWNAQAYCIRLALGQVLCHSIWWQARTLATVPVNAMLRLRLVTLFFQFFLGAEASVGLVLIEQLGNVAVIQRLPLRFAVWTEFAALQKSLVPVETKPPDVGEHRFYVLFSRTLEVGVVEAHDEVAAFVPREQVVEDGCARITDMDVSRWTGCVANSDHCYLHFSMVAILRLRGQNAMMKMAPGRCWSIYRSLVYCRHGYTTGCCHNSSR